MYTQVAGPEETRNSLFSELKKTSYAGQQVDNRI